MPAYVPTAEQMATFGNKLWRLNSLYKVRQEGTGRPIPFKMRQEQQILADHFINMPTTPAYIIKSRRLGISTFVDTNMVDDLAWAPAGYRGLIIDQTQRDATKKMVEIVRFAYDNMHASIRAAYVFDTRNDSEFKIHHATMGSEASASVIEAGTRARGGDCSFLHVSEMGPIAAMDPARAREIRTGALPAVRQGLYCVETTWYGGKSGELWDLVKPVMDGNPNARGVIYFFPWHSDPKAISVTGMVTKEIEDYFLQLAAETGKTFSQEQKKWYAAVKIQQGMWVRREFPSTLAEALAVPMEGSIYGELIDALREKKRIHDFAADSDFPAYTFSDIGVSDYGCMWLVQFVGRDILLLDYYSAEGQNAAHFASIATAWEKKHDIVIKNYFVPHDAAKRAAGTAKPYTSDMIDAGIRGKDIRMVPRIPDVWLGINEMKALLPRCFIHSTNCGRQFKAPGSGDKMIPSGIECLEYYHKKVVDSNGMVYEDPVHDLYSHGASAIRVMAEGMRAGLLEGGSSAARDHRAKPNVLRGAGPSSYGTKLKKNVTVIR